MLRAIDFHGLKGVEFSKGEYTALLIPEMGATVSYTHLTLPTIA